LEFSSASRATDREEGEERSWTVSSPADSAHSRRTAAAGPRAHRYGQEVYRAVFESLAEGVVVLDEGGAVASSNPSAARILGVGSNQLHGATPHDPHWRFIWEDGSPMASEDVPGVRAVSMGDGVQDLAMGVYKPDGSLTWLTVSAQPIGELSVDGPPYRAVVTFADISAEVAAQSQSARQRVMLRESELLNQKILVLVRTAQDAARAGDLARTRLLLARVQRGALRTVTRLGAEPDPAERTDDFPD
jgi:PAS domain S-box-containing protein